MVVLERGEAGEQFVGDREAVGGQLLDGGVTARSNKARGSCSDDHTLAARNSPSSVSRVAKSW
ncbi:hypothetical protein ABZX95_48730 [Streptomyces sp. NPDC004232]|uniref:hypothetical protein n=1 Tax=Streptomyces sp. NPDC004232 TaxID=3154454 RepID=UPI00339F69A9